MFTHNLDPVLFNFGFVSIRWYSLAYVAGILIGWWLGKKIITKRFQNIGQKFNLTEFDDLITYLILSILIGGRVGYIFFYNFDYYISNPIDIIKVWEGGMSFHGALIGKITSVSWGVIFPNIDMFTRHPSQLYEAILEGIVLFLLLNILIFRQRYKAGTCSYLFLIFYGIFRIISELFREPDKQVGYLFDLFSMGTILSFFMILSGLIIFYILRKKNES